MIYLFKINRLEFSSKINHIKMNFNAILQTVFVLLGLCCVLQAYPMENKERELDGFLTNDAEFYDAENTEKSIAKLCVSFIRNRSIDSLDSVVRDACYAVYQRLIEERNSYNRMRRFFALPIAKNQHIQLPPGESASNTGFKYGRK